MKKYLIAALLIFSSPALAQNYQATQGAGTTFGTKLVGGVNYPQQTMCDPTTPANCVAVDASGRITVLQGTSPWVVSNGGTFAVQAAQSGSWTVQPGNTANTTAWLVTGTGGTFPATQSGTWNITNVSGTVSLPTGAATAANQSSQITQETAINTALGTTASAACGTATGTCDITALIKFLNTAATASTPAGTNLIGDVNLRQGGTALSTTNGIYTNLLQGNTVLSITNPVFNRLVATATGGQSTTGNIVANNTTAVVIKASAGTLYGAQLYGIGSAPAYLKIYNATSATCGSGTPVKRLMIPAASTAANGAGSNISFGDVGVDFGTGITYCVTTGIGDADTTAPAASTYLVNLDWK